LVLLTKKTKRKSMGSCGGCAILGGPNVGRPT
jgi:hypothetical protein